MTRLRVAGAILLAGVALLAGWVIPRGVERLMTPTRVTPESPAEAPAPPSVAHISATLFLASVDGQSLVSVRREVPLATNGVEQGRQILLAQLQADEPPFESAIPPGTTLRAFYIGQKGDAFIDLSAEVADAHPGGSSAELLTVQALVNAVAVNLPSITRVQILVAGKEVDTLAGHVDLRRGLRADQSLVQLAEDAQPLPTD